MFAWRPVERKPVNSRGRQLHRPFCSFLSVLKFCVEKCCAVLAEGRGPGEQVKQHISRKSGRKRSTTLPGTSGAFIRSFIHSFIRRFFPASRSKSSFSGFSCRPDKSIPPGRPTWKLPMWFTPAKFSSGIADQDSTAKLVSV